MSARTLPLVFINLGGEMLYILDQRLRAINTSEDNSEKGVWSEYDRKRVMGDIVGTLFSKTFMDELLKPQQMYSHRTMRTVLTRLVHASIMRLNPASMNKLYDLMVMAFKYQVLLCPRPRDLLLISYNHIDSIRDFVKEIPAVLNQVDETHRKVMEVYSSLTDGEFQLLRQTLLIFFQDVHVRVSLFLKNQIQNPNGRFVLPTSGPVPQGTHVPGLIRSLDGKGREVRRGEFPSGGSYSGPVEEGSFTLRGARVTLLGRNMYIVNHLEETQMSGAPPPKVPDDTPNLLAKEELNLLARLMGELGETSSSESHFHINLLAEDQDEEEAGASGGAEGTSFGVITIQALQDRGAASQLAQIAGLFTEEEEGEEASGEPGGTKGDDLLAMMDDL